MAAFTSKANGNWSSGGQTTWNEVGVPGSLDTVTIQGGHSITVDVNTSCGNLSGSGIRVGGTGNGTIIIGVNVTFTMNGGILLGSGTGAAMGTLVFRAGSTLNLGNNLLNLNNCTIRSEATSGNWAKVTGTGALLKGAVAAPIQDVVLDYVSFQNSGVIVISLNGTTGSGTNQLDLGYCVFAGTGNISFGTSTVTPLATNMIIDHTDFVGVGDITLDGVSGTATGTRSITNSVFNNSAGVRKVIYTNNTDGWVCDGNVHYQLDFFTTSATAGGRTIQNSFLSNVPAAAAMSGPIVLNDDEAADTIQDNYFLAQHTDAHIIEATGAVGAGTHLITGNVFQGGNPDDNMILAEGPTRRNIYDNIMIGGGNLVGMRGVITGNGVYLDGNKIYLSADDVELTRGVLFQEPDGVYTGTISVTNNRVAGNVQLNIGVSSVEATITGDTNSYLSSLALSNLLPTNTNAGTLYYDFTGATNTLAIYKDAGKTQEVAEGSGTGTVTISESNASGLAGTIEITVEAHVDESGTFGGFNTLAEASGNVFYNVTYNYSGFYHPTAPVDVDMVIIYADPTRDLAAYDSYKGGAGTVNNAITELLNLNGYSSVTKTQSATPTEYTIAGLVSWVKAGYELIGIQVPLMPTIPTMPIMGYKF